MFFLDHVIIISAYPWCLQLKQKTKGVLLRNCRVKYREPLERLSDKQFILMVDDRGTCTCVCGHT